MLVQLQHRAFPKVFHYFDTRKGTTPAIVRQLDLFVDHDGLLRLRGRLNKSSLLSKDTKNPILVPRSSKEYPCPLTKLLILSYHYLIKHSGVGSTAVAIRQAFWIPKIKIQVKSVLRKCVPCKKLEGPPFKIPPSPDLPEFRVDGSFYEAIGVDLTGELLIKTESGVEKVYICLFTDCLSRHVNLEIVDDLTAASFINAFRRHCAVYSIPHLVISDNATNFELGAKEITEMVEDSDEYIHDEFHSILESEEVQREFLGIKVEFRSIPKRAPWFGGFYERLIGITKRTLKKSFSKKLLTYSQLLTLVKECQAVINDRPLTYLSNEPFDMTPICPSEIVLGKRVTTLPYKDYPDDYDPDICDTSIAIRSLQKCQKSILEHFRNRFISEYLVNLRERHQYDRKDHKTFKETVQEGMVCQIHCNAKRQNWKLGVIEDLYRGKDGQVRAVGLRTQTGYTNRAISKLYPIEVTENIDNSVQVHQPTPQVLRRSKRLQAARNIQEQLT